MRPRGQAETVNEAKTVVVEVRDANFNLRQPSHYPHSQIQALSLLVIDLLERVEKLEAKPKRGRPPKSAAIGNVQTVKAVKSGISK